MRERAERAERRRRARSRNAGDPHLERDFALFRRPARPGDQAPGAVGAEISRRAQAANGVSVFLYRNGEELCVEAMGGGACGMADQATSDPLVVATSRTDGSQTHVVGPVSDDVAAVELKLPDGRVETVEPGENVFAAKVPGKLGQVVFVHEDGSRQQVIE